VFLAIVKYRTGHHDEALAQLDLLDALNPSDSIQQLADQLRAEIEADASTTSTSSP